MIRTIARLDIKGDFVIKGIHLEGLRKVGDPNELATKYYSEGVEEILLQDAVAALYGRNQLYSVVEKACEDVFVPITIGGGLRNIDDVKRALEAGADKVAINSQAVHTPEFITESASRFGSQAIVGSIETKRRDWGWEVYIENGRVPTELNAVEWAVELEKRGAGELLITSIDQEGTKKGFEVELMKAINEAVSLPVICCGGFWEKDHLKDLLDNTVPGAIASASAFHYNNLTVGEVKEELGSLLGGNA